MSLDLTFASATGFVSFGIVLGLLIAERMWWLLDALFPRRARPRPLPRPWRPVLRYLAPGTVWRDVRRCWTTGRWTAGAAGSSDSSPRVPGLAGYCAPDANPKLPLADLAS